MSTLFKAGGYVLAAVIGYFGANWFGGDKKGNGLKSSGKADDGLSDVYSVQVKGEAVNLTADTEGNLSVYTGVVTPLAAEDEFLNQPEGDGAAHDHDHDTKA